MTSFRRISSVRRTWYRDSTALFSDFESEFSEATSGVDFPTPAEPVAASATDDLPAGGQGSQNTDPLP